jgi:MFS superfamily sulfate permease-like transporter
MIGIGTANLAAGLFQGFAVSTSGSRTAVAEQSGAKTQAAGVVGATLVALLLLFLNGLLEDLPQATLAAVVIVAAIGLADVPAVRRFFTVRRSAGVLSLVTTLGVVLFGVLTGIGIALGLAVIMFFRRSWWPHGEVLGTAPGIDGWHSVAATPDARERPGIVVFRWEAPLFFANANAFRNEVRELVITRSPRWVVLQCEAMTDIDVTAGAVLTELDEELNAQGVHLAFAEMRSRIQALVLRYGLLSTLDHEHFYPTLESALAAIPPEPGAPAG